MPFVAGWHLKPSFLPVRNYTGEILGATFELDVLSHDLREWVEKHAVMGASHNGYAAVVAGPYGCEGGCVLCFDNESRITEKGIRAGTAGVMFFPFGVEEPFSVPCLITEVTWQTKVEDKVIVSCRVVLNVLASNNQAPFIAQGAPVPEPNRQDPQAQPYAGLPLFPED